MAISQETLNLFEDDIQEFKKEEYFRNLPPIERDPKVVETPAELIKDTKFAEKEYGPVEKFLNSSWRAIAGGSQDFLENISKQAYEAATWYDNKFNASPVRSFAEYQKTFLEDKDSPQAGALREDALQLLNNLDKTGYNNVLRAYNKLPGAMQLVVPPPKDTRFMEEYSTSDYARFLEIPDSEGAIEGFTRSLTRFVLGMVSAKKITKPVTGALKLTKKAKKTVDWFLGGTLAYQIAFDPEEANFADLIMAFEEGNRERWFGPIFDAAEKLQDKPEDSEAKKRLKQYAQDVILNTGLFMAWNVLKFTAGGLKSGGEKVLTVVDETTEGTKYSTTLSKPAREKKKEKKKRDAEDYDEQVSPGQKFKTEELLPPDPYYDSSAVPMMNWNNINVRKYAESTDIEADLKDMADVLERQDLTKGKQPWEDPTLFPKTRGTRQTQKITIQRAKEMVGDDPEGAKIMKMIENRVSSPELVVAAKMIFYQAYRNARRTAEEYRAKGNKGEDTALDEARMVEAWAHFTKITDSLAGLTSNAGRVMDAFKIRIPGTARSKAKHLRGVTKEVLNTIKSTSKIKSKFGGTSDADDLAKAILNDGPDGLNIFGSRKLIEDTRLAKVFKKATTLAYFNMLSDTATLSVNVFGSGVVQAIENLVINPAAYVIGAGKAAVGKGAEDRLKFGSALMRPAGAIHGLASSVFTPTVAPKKNIIKIEKEIEKLSDTYTETGDDTIFATVEGLRKQLAEEYKNLENLTTRQEAQEYFRAGSETRSVIVSTFVKAELPPHLQQTGYEYATLPGSSRTGFVETPITDMWSNATKAFKDPKKTYLSWREGLKNLRNIPTAMGEITSKTLGGALTVPMRGLIATDAMLKNTARLASVYEQAYEAAFQHFSKNGKLKLKEGFINNSEFRKFIADYIKDIPEEAFEKSLGEAAFLTFTKENLVSRAVIQAVGAPGMFRHVATRPFIPFVQTVSNLWEYGLLNSPLSRAMPRYKQDIAKGGADADRAVARMYVGTSITGIAYLGGKGFFGEEIDTKGTNITTDYRFINTLEAADQFSFSVRYKGEIHEYNRLDPYAMPFAMGADLVDIENLLKAVHSQGDRQFTDYAEVAVKAIMASMYRNVADRNPALMGVQEMGQAIYGVSSGLRPDAADAAVETEGAQGVLRTLGKRYAQTFLSPAIGRKLYSQADPYILDTYTLTDTIKTGLLGYATIVGGREWASYQLNIYGDNPENIWGLDRVPFKINMITGEYEVNEVYRDGGWAQQWSRLWNTHTPRDDELAEALVRIGWSKARIENDFFLMEGQKFGANHEFTRFDYMTYQQTIIRDFRAKAGLYIRTDQYNDLLNRGQNQVIKKELSEIYNDAVKYGKGYMVDLMISRGDTPVKAAQIHEYIEDLQKSYDDRGYYFKR